MTFAYINSDNELNGPYTTWVEIKWAVLSDAWNEIEFVEALSSNDCAPKLTHDLKTELFDLERAIAWNKENQTDALGLKETLAYYENRNVASDWDQHRYVGV